MNSKDVNNWIMYHEIHKLSRMGFSCPKIARYAVMDSRTVRKYLNMTEDEYEDFLIKNQYRHKLLNPYEDFVREKLAKFPETSSAQIFDWLKEHYPDLPKVSVRTVYNFTMFVRQKHNIPVAINPREYGALEDLPYGYQAQVDFGVYNMRTSSGKRKKVWFFTMVLSRSRMKYVWFSDKSFTSLTTCQAHEKSFSFFNGVPLTIVYDQDRVMVVDENFGDIILTRFFREYTRSRSFGLHFCRKADPESKGKVENVVQYVKKNFLYNRLYHDVDTLNQEALAWLGRTANALEHNYTKRIPASEFLVEKKHLKPYFPMQIEEPEEGYYSVRKNNVVAFKSNFYSVPTGTYQKGIMKVILKEKIETIEIFTTDGVLICTHKKAMGKGRTISNSNHKRDRSKSILQMSELVASRFSSMDTANRYLAEIKSRYPRYMRDQLQCLQKVLGQSNDASLNDKTLDFCIQNQLYSATEFVQAWHVLEAQQDVRIKLPEIKPLGGNETFTKTNETPLISDIDDYESIFNA
ncbi:IS21 family transposase [Anaerophaga thermohalophila]|uniref:IS21 family transposase n=1 Tax=Anaerophaga thermohalophila TaxID=177400 RepID=UPI00037D9F77|nr:IS21 family transposase [Anaerophaga thermohalophila]